MILEIVFLIFALFFGCAWGAAENRAWKESGQGWLLAHFKLYHVLMGVLFGWVNALTVTVVFQNTFTFQGALLWVWLMLWDTLLLDVVWWVIRYIDITHIGQEIWFENTLLWKYPVTNEYDYGQGKPWHNVNDWDNFLRPRIPLVYGTYWWWYVFSGVLILLGVYLGSSILI